MVKLGVSLLVVDQLMSQLEHRISNTLSSGPVSDKRVTKLTNKFRFERFRMMLRFVFDELTKPGLA